MSTYKFKFIVDAVRENYTALKTHQDHSYEKKIGRDLHKTSPMWKSRKQSYKWSIER